ncbi:MAG TPA: hypothetical protein VE999_13060 [Gemmataceae bacterium]|jgi:hypothetical protein|nr:hypothetical protein [Gemmataceae bacterium]
MLRCEPVAVLDDPSVRCLLPSAARSDVLPPLDAFAIAVSVTSSSAIGPIMPIIAARIFIALLALAGWHVDDQRLDRSERCTWCKYGAHAE